MKKKKNIPADLPGAGRVPVVDLMRGWAIVMMVAYHFCFDLNYFGLMQANMNYDPFWLRWRAVIVSSFLLVMGASLWLAAGRGIRWPGYLRRLGLLVAAAVLVSLASWLMFPRSWIFFGVLHFIAAATVLGLLFVRLHPGINLAAGAALLAFSLNFSSRFFDQPGWQWFGLMTHKPITEDYVPLLPWFGVVLIGIAFGRLLFGAAQRPSFATWGCGNPAARALAMAGRHSLLIYLIHQPLLLGILWAFQAVSSNGA